MKETIGGQLLSVDHFRFNELKYFRSRVTV